ADAVVEEVELGVVGVPAPSGAAAPLPLVALPGADAEVLALVRRIVGIRVAVDQDFAVRTSAVGGPQVRAAVGVEGRDAAANAELTAGDARDDHFLARLGLDVDRGVGHGSALLVAVGLDTGVGLIRVLGLPQLLAGLRVEGDQLTL